jgi:hypothetical protein
MTGSILRNVCHAHCFQMPLARSFKTQATSLPVVASAPSRVTCVVLRLCILIPPVGLTMHLGLCMHVRMTRLNMGQNTGQQGSGPHHEELHGSLLSASLTAAQAQDRDLSSALEGDYRLLCSGDADDVLQLVVHHVHLIGGGCWP